MKRGELWWADLPVPVGSTPGFRRPVIIVQADSFTVSRIGTVAVITVTTNLRLALAPGNVRLSKTWTGLRHDSVANVSQLIALDKELLLEPITTLNAGVMHKIDLGLRALLSLA